MNAPDVCIAWLSVHGGVFHKLLKLQEVLERSGISCELLFSCGPPRGLKIGVDVCKEHLPELAERRVYFLPKAEVLSRVEDTRARLLITDAHHDPDLPVLIAHASARGLRTAQMATLLHDFACYGAQHLLMQHPLTLFYELEYHRTRESRSLQQAHGIHFTGNIFYEPTVNTINGGFVNRQAFCSKYGFDSSRPICLWLPNYADVKDATYGQVVEAAAQAGVNLAVKLHPWEYAFKKHGTDTWGLGTTSDVMWRIRAVEEPDSTWAYQYCDMAVMRTSATSLEMPFWNKPIVLLPSTAYPGLIGPQTRMVERCAVQLRDASELLALLRNQLPAFSGADFAAARAQVRLNTEVDAYSQTAACVAGILAQNGNAAPLGYAALRRLYYPHATHWIVEGLQPRRRLYFKAARLMHRLME